MATTVLKYPVVLAVSVMCLELAAQGRQQLAPTGQPATNLGSDASGNPLRLALKTGHVSNYDESKVRPYILPNPLVLTDGRRVGDAKAWRTRRAEIVQLYETEIYGRVPANAPAVTWQVLDTDRAALGGAAVMRHVVGVMGSMSDGPRINLTVYTPANAAHPVPMILMVNFGGGDAARGRGPAALPGPSPGTEILARGWGYATVGYQDIQPDRAGAWTQGVIGLTLSPGQLQPAPD